MARHAAVRQSFASPTSDAELHETLSFSIDDGLVGVEIRFDQSDFVFTAQRAHRARATTAGVILL